MKWPRPITLKPLNEVLGLRGYYRKFIKDYGAIAAPLTALLKKYVFSWNEKIKEAFEILKVFVTHPLTLSLPELSKTFTIECNASRFGIGAVLMQEGKPIDFLKKVLKGKELHLSTYEELLAIVMVVQTWRPYLLGQYFIIKNNQQSLKYLIEQKIRTPSQHKWIYKLLGMISLWSTKLERKIRWLMPCLGRRN